MNICLICEASLSHHTFVYGKFGPCVYIMFFPVGQNIAATILKPTDDQKLGGGEGRGTGTLTLTVTLTLTLTLMHITYTLLNAT